MNVLKIKKNIAIRLSNKKLPDGLGNFMAWN